MPNVLHVSVDNSTELLNAGAYDTGALIQIQFSATEAGAFSDLSGTGSTPTIALVAGTKAYTGYDPGGTSTTWYRTRYRNAAGTRTSDWSDAFQVGDETAGLLCSLYDVKQRVFGSAAADTPHVDDELIMEIIAQVSDEIEDYVGQWLAPRPTAPSSTTTLLFDVPYDCSSLLLRQTNDRIVGIRTVTQVEVASTSQPESGGTYTTATLADVLVRPRPSGSEPGLRLVLTDRPTGSVGAFYGGFNTLRVTGAFGPESVAPRVTAVALVAATRRYATKGTAAPAVAVGPDGGVTLLADIGPAMMRTLDRLRIMVAA